MLPGKAELGRKEKGRARDVLDILLVDILGQLDLGRTPIVADHIFRERATHGFPPKAALPEEWRPELENLAEELGTFEKACVIFPRWGSRLA